MPKKLETIAFRELREFINANEIEAAFIISGTGNLSRANLQLANGMVDVYRGKFDVISISGILSVNFQADLKIMLADDTGKTFGKMLTKSRNHFYIFFV